MVYASFISYGWQSQWHKPDEASKSLNEKKSLRPTWHITTIYGLEADVIDYFPFPKPLHWITIIKKSAIKICFLPDFAIYDWYSLYDYQIISHFNVGSLLIRALRMLFLTWLGIIHLIFFLLSIPYIQVNQHNWGTCIVTWTLGIIYSPDIFEGVAI